MDKERMEGYYEEGQKDELLLRSIKWQDRWVERLWKSMMQAELLRRESGPPPAPVGVTKAVIIPSNFLVLRYNDNKVS